MSKENWIEVLSSINTKDWSDWITFYVSILTPILLLITMMYTAKAAKASKDAVQTSLEIYEDDKSERALLIMPIFEIRDAIFSVDTEFKLVNINNQHAISITSYGLPANKFTTEKISDNVVKICLKKYEMKDQQSITIHLQYTALNHRFYKTFLEVRRDNGTMFIDNINTKLLKN